MSLHKAVTYDLGVDCIVMYMDLNWNICSMFNVLLTTQPKFFGFQDQTLL